MINAILLLRQEAQVRRSMTTPNAHTITEYTAKENEKLADEHELAAEMLRKMYNERFTEGFLMGMKSLVESDERRRKKKGEKTCLLK